MIRILFLALLILPFCGCNAEDAATENNLASENSLSIISKDGQEHRFEVELALTPQEMAKGLMYRESMPEEHGMLFYFGQEREVGFWMRNTLIPLDMIFIQSDGTISHIHENAVPHDETAIPSDGLVRAVLELNGGTAQKFGILVGDQVRHEFFAEKSAE